MKRIFILIASVISLIAMSLPASAYEPTVREDRVWEYYSDYFVSVFMDINYAWARFKFEGTTEVNGKTYHKWVKFEEVIKKGIVDRDTGCINFTTLSKDTMKQTFALMREDDGKIWICLEKMPGTSGFPEEYRIVCNSDSVESDAVTEGLLYDFSVNKGDSLTWVGSVNGALPSSSLKPYQYLSRVSDEIVETDSIEINGAKCKTYKFEISGCRSPFVQGIGMTRALLPYPSIDELVHSSSYDYSLSLNGVYDGEGNRIFGEWKNPMPGEGGIPSLSVTDSSDNRKYDLMGREIKEPAPGTVYIQGGRKLIAR